MSKISDIQTMSSSADSLLQSFKRIVDSTAQLSELPEIKIEPLNEESFVIFDVLLRSQLSLYELDIFLDTTPTSVHDDANFKKLNRFVRDNLISNVDREFWPFIKNEDLACNAYKKLKELCVKWNMPLFVRTFAKAGVLMKDKSDDMDQIIDTVRKLKSMFELAKETDLEDMFWLALFVNSLPESMTDLKSTLCGMYDEGCRIESILSRALKEKHILAFMAEQSPKPRTRVMQADFQQMPENANFTDGCWECGDPDHNRKYCRKYQTRVGNRRRNGQQSDQNTSENRSDERSGGRRYKQQLSNNQNWLHPSSRKSQQSSSDAISNLRKLQEGTKPKTIDQVHEDLKRKQEEATREINREMSKRNDPVKKRNDDWMYSSSRKSQQSSSDVITNLRKLQEQRNNSTATLGPSFGFAPKVANWSQGANAAKSSPTNSSDKRTLNQVPSRNNSRLDDSRSSSKKSLFRGNYTGGNDDRDLDFIDKYSSSIQKYVKSLEIDSLINSLYDQSTEECTYLFVVAAIDCVFGSLLKNITQVGELLVEIVVSKKIIPQSQFHKGLKHHLDQSQELLTDVPKFFEYVGNILSHFFFKLNDDERRLFFKQTLEPCLEFDTSIIIVAHLIKHSIQSKDVVEVAKKWSSGKMVLSDFSTKQNEEQLKELLIKQHNLEEFINELNNSNCKSVKSPSAPFDQILSDDCPFDELPKLMKNNLSASDNDMNKKLISAFLERCIKDCSKKNSGYSFDKQGFESKFNTILPLKQLDDPELQLDILLTAAKINHEYESPKDYLLNIFTFLVDLKIVSKKVILRWANDKRDNEQGHTISLLQLKRFIDKIDSQQDDDE